jgi:hypothetical protein
VLPPGSIGQLRPIILDDERLGNTVGKAFLTPSGALVDDYRFYPPNDPFYTGVSPDLYRAMLGTLRSALMGKEPGEPLPLDVDAALAPYGRPFPVVVPGATTPEHAERIPSILAILRTLTKEDRRRELIDF